MVGTPLRVLFIGRLDSYKRLDWLQALVAVQASWHLDVVGEGHAARCLKISLCSCLANKLLIVCPFLGRLSEADKLALLDAADLLVLPSDRSNEAFGIVQLEAMASGIPALAFRCDRSGMGWVSRLSGFDWPQTPKPCQMCCSDWLMTLPSVCFLGSTHASVTRVCFGELSGFKKLIPGYSGSLSP